MTRRDILAGLGILGAFGVGALILLWLVPNFFASEDKFPTRTSTAVAQAVETLPATPSTVRATSTLVPTTPIALTATPTLASIPTAVLASATATAKPTSIATPAQASAAIPQITQQPYTLPKGIGPSEGAKSCPQPLPVEKIRSDYLAYWDALKQAYKEGNPDLLVSFVDTKARDGKLWQGERDAIVKAKQNGYWLDYQIEHTDPLIVKINPYFGGVGQCQVSVFDGTKLSVLAKKIGTNEPFTKDRATPQVQQYKPSHSFEMMVQNGRWVIAGEGAGEL